MCMLCHEVRSALCNPMDSSTRLLYGIFKQQYWRGLLFSLPKDFPNPGIEPTSPVSHELTMDSLPLSHQTMIGHVKRAQGSALSGSSWPNQEKLKHQNNDSKGL